MKRWLTRLRGAVGMGLTWAAGWAATGLLIGVTSILTPGLPWDSFFEFFDAPLPALGVPGFFGGAIFSIVLGIAARRRRFDELSLPKFAAWGALGGLLLGLVPAAMVSVGLATLRSDLRVWQLTATIAGPLVLLSAVSAAVSLLVARRAESPVSAIDSGLARSQALIQDEATPKQSPQRHADKVANTGK